MPGVSWGPAVFKLVEFGFDVIDFTEEDQALVKELGQAKIWVWRPAHGATMPPSAMRDPVNVRVESPPGVIVMQLAFRSVNDFVRALKDSRD